MIQCFVSAGINRETLWKGTKISRPKQGKNTTTVWLMFAEMGDILGLPFWERKSWMAIMAVCRAAEVGHGKGEKKRFIPWGNWWQHWKNRPADSLDREINTDLILRATIQSLQGGGGTMHHYGRFYSVFLNLRSTHCHLEWNDFC